MLRLTQPAPETFIEFVLRLLASYERKRSEPPAKLCTSVKTVEIEAKTA